MNCDLRRHGGSLGADEEKRQHEAESCAREPSLTGRKERLSHSFSFYFQLMSLVGVQNSTKRKQPPTKSLKNLVLVAFSLIILSINMFHGNSLYEL